MAGNIIMALPARFALLNSDYNPFLFAPIGEEGDTNMLSVLSAFTRLELDPWAEAAGLAALPEPASMAALASLIERLPGRRWSSGEATTMATRLVRLLPKHAPAAPLNAMAAAVRSKTIGLKMLMFVAALTLVLVLQRLLF
jgi:hypothetical protein